MNHETPPSSSPDRRQWRMEHSPALLRGGFRLFFLGGAVWAIVALIVWVLAFTGYTTLPSSFDPLAWHRHEMLFGFVGAVIAGFLLAAIPNWTGCIPIAGAPAAALFFLWLVGRLAVLFSGAISPVAAMLIDVSFFIVFAGVAAREVIAAKNRNLPIVALVLLFGLANCLDHLGAVFLLIEPATGSRAAIGLVALMISVIGGRIIPAFTRNWLAKRGDAQRLPATFSSFDGCVIAATAASFLLWILWPASTLAGAILLVAGALQALRLFRWAGSRTVRDPLVFVLHLGYAWLPTGMALLGASILLHAIPASAAIHALTAGAMATMILAVMTRATLGHTGRELKAGGATVLIYGFITLSALLRVLSSLGGIPYMGGVEASALSWCAAFLLFVIVYGPFLWGPRRDGKLY